MPALTRLLEWLLKHVQKTPGGEELPKGWLDPEEDSLIPPRSLWIGPRDPISHHNRWVWEYLAYLTILTELRRDAKVLELACGHGRTARGLLAYLRSPGEYCGIDVDSRLIADARQRIETRFPNFRFIHADVYNRQYNPQGQVSGARYVFPFDGDAFDVIYAASLFSHLLPNETEQYLFEASRVLKRGGRCLFSFFMLDNYRGPGTTTSPDYVFGHPLRNYEGVAVRFPDFPDVLVGYRRSVIEESARAAGLNILHVIPGLWTENTGWAVNEQDLILLTKP